MTKKKILSFLWVCFLCIFVTGGVWLFVRHKEQQQIEARPQLTLRELTPALVTPPATKAAAPEELAVPAAAPQPLLPAQAEKFWPIPFRAQTAGANAPLPLPSSYPPHRLRIQIPWLAARPLPLPDTGPQLQPPQTLVIDPHWQPLMTRLIDDGFDPNFLRRAFGALGSNAFSPAYMATKVTELHGVLGISPPGRTRLQPDGYTTPLENLRTSECVQFIQMHTRLVEEIRTEYAVTPHIILAIMLIETAFGENLGSTPALQALASLAITENAAMLGLAGNSRQAKTVPAKALQKTLQVKSAWAYEELKALLAYAQGADINPASLPGSVYGAVGLCQFMPSNILPYAVDGDKNGTIDLFSPIDAMFSIANFLAEHGWRGAKTREGQLTVLLNYNQDMGYASQVLAVAAHMEKALAGKKSSDNPLASAGRGIPGGVRDPSLKRLGRVSRKGKVSGLDDYGALLGI